MTGFAIAPRAEIDLEEIFDYIATDNPSAAREMLAEFFAAFERLATHPLAGHVREGLAPGRGLRIWSVRAYLVIYDPAPRPIGIVRVLDGHRDVETVLAMDDPSI